MMYISHSEDNVALRPYISTWIGTHIPYTICHNTHKCDTKDPEVTPTNHATQSSAKLDGIGSNPLDRPLEKLFVRFVVILYYFGRPLIWNTGVIYLTTPIWKLLCRTLLSYDSTGDNAKQRLCVCKCYHKSTNRLGNHYTRIKYWWKLFEGYAELNMSLVKCLVRIEQRQCINQIRVTYNFGKYSAL